MAVFFCTYVDDRTGDSTEAACTCSTHVVDAPRKRRNISQTPGAWSGAMVLVEEGDSLYVTCSQEKWDKARAIIARILDNYKGGGKSWSLDDIRGSPPRTLRAKRMRGIKMKGATAKQLPSKLI